LIWEILEKIKPREPIAAKLVADVISAAGADRILAVDLHVQSIQGFFDIPVHHMDHKKQKKKPKKSIKERRKEKREKQQQQEKGTLG